MSDKQVLVVNLDGTGAGTRIWIGGGGTNGELVGRLRRAALEEEVKVSGPWRAVGMVADHIPFTASGIDAVTLSGVSRKLLKVHTRSDRKDLLEIDTMDRVGRLVLKFLTRLND